MFRRFLNRALVAFALVVAPLSAGAQQLVSMDDIVQISVLPGWRLDNGNRMAAVRIDLAKGWKTYWRSPGAAGIPPRLDLSQSRNIAAAEIHWPTPEVFDLYGLRSIGYEGALVLPLELTPKDPAPGGQIRLRGELELGVCKDICIPHSVRLAIDLEGDGANDKLIRSSLASQPISADAAGVGAVVCTITPIEDGLRVAVDVSVPRMGSNEFAVIELADPTIWVAPADVQRTGNVLNAVTELVTADARPFALDRSRLKMTLLADGSPGVEINGCTAG